MSSEVKQLTARIEEALLERNHVSDRFFSREAGRLALACRDMAERFLQGGRLLAFGRGPYATDAQHVSVEFVHPVIVGKRALPDGKVIQVGWQGRGCVVGAVRPGTKG